MSDIIPSTGSSPSLLAPFQGNGNATMPEKLRQFAEQPMVRRAAPWFAGVAALGLTALAWSTFMPATQRMLYSALDDAERAKVVATLDKAAISYVIDPRSGALSVDEADLYKARMLVASDGALAVPETGSAMLDKLPMGASRTLEADRLRSALEQDLALSIAEIEGVESARVRIAQAEKSVFVREDLPPSASVMLRIVKGRQLSIGQVTAIRNLIAAGVPGMTTDAVQVVDQNGKLLSQADNADTDRIALQTRIEDKIRNQIEQLLRPVVGAGNFSSEVQVELDLDDSTSARESYEKDGVVRSETLQQTQTSAAGAVGVPGVLSNTPPPQTTAQPGAPLGTPSAGPASNQTTGENASSRTFELGRQVTVSSVRPGKIKRLSVAVALKNAKPAEVEQLKQLVSSAVGADTQRGDLVTVVARAFNAEAEVVVPFYEASWFGMLIRYGAGLIAVLMVLLFAVRPLIKKAKANAVQTAEEDGERDALSPATGGSNAIDTATLERQVNLARKAVEQKPENAVLALRQMLNDAKEAAV